MEEAAVWRHPYDSRSSSATQGPIPDVDLIARGPDLLERAPLQVVGKTPVLIVLSPGWMDRRSPHRQTIVHDPSAFSASSAVKQLGRPLV